MSKRGSSSRSLTAGQLTLFDCQSSKRKNTTSGEFIDLTVTNRMPATCSSICLATAANSYSCSTESGTYPVASCNVADEAEGSHATEYQVDIELTEEFEPDFFDEVHGSNPESSEAPG